MSSSLYRSGIADKSVSDVITRYMEVCNPNCGTPSVFSNTTCLLSYDYSYFKGRDTPHYHRRCRAGELLPQTPFEQFFAQGDSNGVYDLTFDKSYGYDRIWADGNYSRFDHWVVTPERILDYVPADTDVYVQNAAAKIYAEGHDTLTFIAELADAKRMFFSTGQKLLKLEIPTNWRSFSNDWLSVRYGWRPFISDIKTLHDKVTNLDSGIKRYSKRAGGKRQFTNENEWTTEGPNAYEHHFVSDDVTVEYRGSVVADIDLPQFQINPLITAWEVIPYSFVIDWFVSVGKALAAISFVALQSSHSASKGFKLTVNRTYLYEMETKPGTSGTYTQSGNCTATLVKRTPCSVPFKPRLSLRMNAAKVMDLVALATQLTRR